MGLKWSDCELGDEPRIVIRRSLSWARAAGEADPVRPKFYPPKTRSGFRTIPISHDLSHMLKAWKIRCPVSELDLVFPRPDGRPLQRSMVSAEGMKPACRRAGLRGMPFRTLRHSAASGWLMGGASIVEVAATLGHATPAITLKVYTRFIRSQPSGAIGRFSDGFLPSASGSGQKVGTL